MTTLILKLETLATSDVRDVSRDLCQLADRVGVLCEVNFNGVLLWARPGVDPLKLVDAYHVQLRKSFTTRIAQVE